LLFEDVPWGKPIVEEPRARKTEDSFDSDLDE
jgi:hypothetical protein